LGLNQAAVSVSQLVPLAHEEPHLRRLAQQFESTVSNLTIPGIELDFEWELILHPGLDGFLDLLLAHGDALMPALAAGVSSIGAMTPFFTTVSIPSPAGGWC
jgi:hypothetical protein